MAVPRAQTAREENQRCLCWWAPMMLQRTLGNSGQPRQPSVCSVTAEENNNIIVQAVCSSKPPSELSRCLHFTDTHWISVSCSADSYVSLDSCPVGDTEQWSDRVWITRHLWGPSEAPPWQYKGCVCGTNEKRHSVKVILSTLGIWVLFPCCSLAGMCVMHNKSGNMNIWTSCCSGSTDSPCLGPLCLGAWRCVQPWSRNWDWEFQVTTDTSSLSALPVYSFLEGMLNV